MKLPTSYSEADRKVSKIALLIGLACVLQISESLIPHPLPGLRLGLANMLTLTAMVVLGFGYALEVAVLRTVLSSFIMGTFMSPTFILSFASAVISTLVMGFFYWLSGLSRYCRLSIIGISVIGAFVHNLVQLYLAYLLLVKHPGVFAFFPWLSIGAVATGWVVGVVSGGACRRLLTNDQGPRLEGFDRTREAFEIRSYVAGTSWLHHLPAQFKLIGLLALAIILLTTTHFGIYLGCFLLVGALLPFSGTPFGFLLSTVRKYLVLIVTSFLLPLLFNTGDHLLADFGLFKMTAEGLRIGSLLGARILLLVMVSALFMRTTAPADLIDSLGRLLRPLHLFGIAPQRIATLLSLAWTALPQLWRTTRSTIAAADLKKTKNLREMLPLLSGMVAALYVNAEPAHHMWKHALQATQRDSKDAGCHHSEQKRRV